MNFKKCCICGGDLAEKRCLTCGMLMREEMRYYYLHKNTEAQQFVTHAVRPPDSAVSNQSKGGGSCAELQRSAAHRRKYVVPKGFGSSDEAKHKLGIMIILVMIVIALFIMLAAWGV